MSKDVDFILWIFTPSGAIVFPEVVSMTLIEWLKAKKTLWIVAIQQGTSMTQVRASIQESIDDAWQRAWQPGNLEAQAHWQLLFPGGKKPTVEQFIVGLAKKLDDDEEPPYLLS
jgi:hypothetical protein